MEWECLRAVNETSQYCKEVPAVVCQITSIMIGDISDIVIRRTLSCSMTFFLNFDDLLPAWVNRKGNPFEVPSRRREEIRKFLTEIN
jgi:hypothetical protein